MRAAQNFFLEKIPFLENKKSIKKIFYLRFDFSEYNIDIKEYILQKKLKILKFLSL